MEGTRNFSATAGVEKVGKVGVEMKGEEKRSFTRKHFDRGAAELMVANDMACGVNWYCEQNDLQK